MKFLKRFKELNESKDKGGIKIRYYYTQCDEAYGYMEFSHTGDRSDAIPDLEPCRYSTEDFIISEDDENNKQSKEILAKQTGGEWDDDYDYDYYEEEYVDWCDAKIDEWINKYLGSDLWGSVYLTLVKDDGFNGHYESVEGRKDGIERTRTKEEFENEILNTHESILAWVDVTDGYEDEDSDDALIALFDKVYEEDSSKAGEIFLGLSGRHQRIVKNHFEEKGELEFLNTLVAGSEFGLF